MRASCHSDLMKKVVPRCAEVSEYEESEAEFCCEAMQDNDREKKLKYYKRRRLTQRKQERKTNEDYWMAKMRTMESEKTLILTRDAAVLALPSGVRIMHMAFLVLVLQKEENECFHERNAQHSSRAWMM